MSKASRHISIVRPELEELATSHVQARVIVGFCDDRGVPRNKDRFFIVEPRVGRQVQVGNSNQDRANLHPACTGWNYTPDRKALAGGKSIRIRIQHLDIEDAYSVGCICFRAEQDRSAPKPPGKMPYCKSSDMQTAMRYTAQGFQEIPCAGRNCPLRQAYTQESGGKQYRKVDAKTLFRLVGRIDEEGIPPLLVSMVTGSDYNVTQFAGLLDTTAAQWSDLCKAIGVDVPFPGYGLPIRMQVYESTGDNSRFPRIHYTLDCDIEELFRREVERRQRMASFSHQLNAIASPLMLNAPASFDVDDDALDAQEVLNPVSDTPAPTFTVTEAPSSPVTVPLPPTLFQRCKTETLTGSKLRELLTAGLSDGDSDALVTLIGRCADMVRADAGKLPVLSRHLTPFAADVRVACPEAADALAVLGFAEQQAEEEVTRDSE